MILKNTTYFPIGEGPLVTLSAAQIRAKRPPVDAFKQSILANMRTRWVREEGDERMLIEVQKLALDSGYVDRVWLRDGPRPWPARFTIGVFRLEFHPLEEETE
ncbi:hypothetical protein [Azoarcus taiwanensis]|uniref:Uncharacterized protein n=1 Tax=Azoarcus taiwanensis TaxID=666964 RepID=A0A972F8K0_9RHOO|nr:hypothetical protein [Azoarcus taiwanensis]NMG04106.1 hypothetical protein [Azoarcus taiwanensis]